jgi:hypothetical protein
LAVPTSDCLIRDTEWDRVLATDADTVELKVLLAPGDDTPRAVADTMGRTRRRRLYLLDTAGARFTRAGLAVRLRRLGTRRADLTVRARGIEHSGERRPGVRVELDVLPGSLFRSEQVARPLDVATAAAFAAGGASVSTLLSEDQRGFLRRVGSDLADDAVLDGLQVHGPLVVERTRIRDDRWEGARAFLERCLLPDGTRLDEISVRCLPADAWRAGVVLCRFLEERGLRPAERHLSKMQALVEGFADHEARAADAS